MKFTCRYVNGKPYEWKKFTKNPFTHNFIHRMVLTSVQNDRVLVKEFAEVIEKYKDVAYYDCDCKKLNWLKQFKGAQYVVATVHIDDFKAFDKAKFEIIGYDTMPQYLIMIRKMF